MRQGNDVGSQYRSAIFYRTQEQREAAEASAESYGKALATAGYGPITTQIVPAGEFYFAEDYHQQYLYKVPYGYCPDHSTGVTCPVGILPAWMTPRTPDGHGRDRGHQGTIRAHRDGLTRLPRFARDD
jgi:hypothetical protein